MSVVLGSRLLQGPPGSKVSAHHPSRQRRRAAHGGARPGGARRLWRSPAGSCGRASGSSACRRSDAHTPAQIREQFAAVRQAGRRTGARRPARHGGRCDSIRASRPRACSSRKGVLATRESRTGKTPIEAGPNDGGVAAPVLLLVDNGTSGAAEVFAAALVGNGRTTLVGERTLGRAATQELVKLPDGSALWLSTTRYLAPNDAVIHEKGLKPDVIVEAPDVEFGAPPPDHGSDSRQGARGDRPQEGRLTLIAPRSPERARYRCPRSLRLRGALRAARVRLTPVAARRHISSSRALNRLTRVEPCRITRLALPRTARRAARAASGGLHEQDGTGSKDREGRGAQQEQRGRRSRFVLRRA